MDNEITSKSVPPPEREFSDIQMRKLGQANSFTEKRHQKGIYKGKKNIQLGIQHRTQPSCWG